MNQMNEEIVGRSDFYKVGISTFDRLEYVE